MTGSRLRFPIASIQSVLNDLETRCEGVKKIFELITKKSELLFSIVFLAPNISN